MLKNRIIYNEYSPWVFGVSKASGSYIWDEDGRKLIDFTCGWNVTNLGWNNSEISEAIIKQARKNSYAPMWTSDPIQDEYAHELTESLPRDLRVVGRATGGTEANEEAIKTARAFTGRKKIVGFKNTYHGQSFGTMSLGYLPEYVEAISPMVGGFIQIDFPETYRDERDGGEILRAFSINLEKILSKKDVAAIVCEAGMVTGWGDARIAPKGFVKVVRELTKKYGTLMILDEVGTGFSRCGKLFGMQIEGVVPDIVTFAKGLSNGASAIGAMVTREEIAKESCDKSNVTSTFGWVPIACAAALKTLHVHKRDKTWEKSKKNGELILSILRKELKGNPFVGDIRGMGMEIGLELVKDKETKERNPDLLARVITKAREKGLHLVGDNESVVQIMPPITTENKTLQKGLDILVNTLEKV